MTTVASLVACGVFVAAMLHAAVTDLRHRRISNRLVAGLAACWPPAALAAGIPGAEMAAALAVAVMLFAGGVACFAAGWVGGGDVKLAAVAVLWLGAGQAAAFVLLTTAFGAALTALVVLAAPARRAARLPAGRPAVTAGRAAGDAAAPRPAAVQVPYGPALAAAGLVLLQGSPWAAAL